MNNFLKSFSVIALACALATPANAGISCDISQINRIEQSNDGSVFLHVDWGIVGVCSVQRPVGYVEPSACQGWLSLFITSFIQRKPIQMYFNNDPGSLNDGMNTCTGNGYGLRQPQSVHFPR